MKKLPKLPIPRIRLNPARNVHDRTRWICSLLGAKLNIGYGRSPQEAYEFWNAKHGTRDVAPSVPASRPRGFNSDDRL